MKRMNIFLAVFLLSANFAYGKDTSNFVNITSKTKLYEFFESNFPQHKWPKEIEEKFNIYIDSITKDMKRDNLFIWKGDFDESGKYSFLLLNFSSITEKGIYSKDGYIGKYADNDFKREFELKIFKRNQKQFLGYYTEIESYEDELNDERTVDFEVNKWKEIGGKLSVKNIIYSKEEVGFNDKYLQKDKAVIASYCYSKWLNSYVFVSNYSSDLSQKEDFKLWFAYNYPDNSDKWPKKAKKSFDRTIKVEKWDFIHKGDLLGTGSPAAIFINYSTTSHRGKEEMILTALKIMKYKKGKWVEKLKIENGNIYTDSVLHEEYFPSYDSKGYYNVVFSLNDDRTLIIDFQGYIVDEINQEIQYSKNKDIFEARDMRHPYY